MLKTQEQTVLGPRLQEYVCVQEALEYSRKCSGFSLKFPSQVLTNSVSLEQVNELLSINRYIHFLKIDMIIATS